MEVLGPELGKQVTARRTRRAEADAARDVPPLEKWDGISDRSYATYTSGPNLVRLKRLLELVPPRSRILDIGIGYGYVTGVLLRDAEVASYAGIDLKESLLKATRSMIRTNRLEGADVRLELLDLYELSDEFLGERSPSLVLMLEVLEHVSDPAGALSRVAAAVPDGTQLIFSVPLLGRLEGVWGHLSLFDRARLEAICRQVGLRIDRAEPIANSWAMIVATTGALRPASVDPAPPEAYCFAEVPTDLHADHYRRSGDDAAVTLVPRKAYLDCKIELDAATEGPREGGFRLRVPEPSILRLELELEPPEGARVLQVRGVDRAGDVKLAWAAGEGGRRIKGGRTTYVLKPGRKSKTLKPRASDRRGVEWLEVVLELDPGQATEVKLFRAAYVAGDGSGSRGLQFLRARLAGG